MPLPNFLLIGAAKSGTTALYHILRGHPDVFLPAFKEPYFLSAFRPSPRTVTELEDYRALFEGSADAARVGEASAGYLYDPTSAERIAATLGTDVRLVAILRHPVDRAHSMYWHRRRDAEEALSFEEAIGAEPERIAAGWQLGWHYLAMGRYREQLERYRSRFPSEALLVLNFDEFVADRRAAVDEVTSFLGIERLASLPDDAPSNPSYRIRAPGVERALRQVGGAGGALARLRRSIPAPLRQAAKRMIREVNREGDGYTPLDPALRRELTRGFRSDIEYLAKEFRPSFASWLEDDA